jgi:ABC-type nitrate/sulfonate/bicarbonate transport system permease component
MADVLPRPTPIPSSPPSPHGEEGGSRGLATPEAPRPLMGEGGWGGRGQALWRQSLGVLTLVAILALWEVLSRTRVLNPQFFPPVTDILGTFVALWQNNVFPGHLATTLWRMAVGYAIAAVLGIGLGLVMGRWRAVYDLFEPLVEFLRPMPPVALIPVLILLVGIGDEMKIIVVAFASIFPILLNTVEGVRSVHPTLLDVARTFRYTEADLLRRVILPAALPQIMAGLRISLAIALIVALVSEMIGATAGMGYFVLQAQRGLRIRDMYAAIVMLALLGFALNWLFLLVEARVLAWHRASTGQE